MKTITVDRLSELPVAFQESIIERSDIQSAIANANTFIKYAKQCKKNFKETGEESWLDCGFNALMPYYNKLLAIEFLANKYSDLWLEKFSKCKHDAEKVLNIGL